MIYISEVFGAGLSHKGVEKKASYPTIQGEGALAGRPTIFIRFFGCSLRCEGFSQPDPTNRETYKPTIIQTIDPKSIKRLEDFKTPTVGCDTAYAIYPQFKHLTIKYKDAAELYSDAIIPLLYKDLRGDPSFSHPVTGNMIDLCFTGGEPLLHQDSIYEILHVINGLQKFVTIEYTTPPVTTWPNVITCQVETNGTKQLSEKLMDLSKFENVKLFFNISPKLFTVSGEESAKAWRPAFIFEYLHYHPGTLKFVVNNTDACWDELQEKVIDLRTIGVNAPIYVMPAGAVYHQQTDQGYIREIAERALQNGYCISPRLHVNIWDGCVGC